MEYLFEPAPAEEAIEFIKRKAPLSRAQFERLLPELQGLAFTVSGIEAASVLQDIRDTVATVPAGALVPKVRKELVEKLDAHMAIDEEESTQERLQKLQRRAAFLIRHHGNQAYAQMAYQDLMENADIFTHWKYLTVGDESVRDTHRALDGLVLPQKHEFWQTHFPPWEFGCRCQVVPVTAAEYEAYRQSDEGRAIEERDTLTDEQLEQLTNERALWRKIGGVPVKVDLRAPSETLGLDNPYIFDPSLGLQPDLPSLRDRYDRETWVAFETFARGLMLPQENAEGAKRRSLWTWLSRGGKAGPSRPREPRGNAPRKLPASDGATKGGYSGRKDDDAPGGKGGRKSFADLQEESFRVARDHISEMTREQILDLAREENERLPAQHRVAEKTLLREARDMATRAVARRELDRLWKEQLPKDGRESRPMPEADDSDVVEVEMK